MLLYYGFGYGYFDPTYILVIIATILVMLAQGKVSSAYNKYSRIRNSRGLTGAEVANRIIQMHNLNVHVEKTSGQLTDHYDPTRKVVRLSTNIYEGTSIASLAVAAHECGHAIQHQENYGALRLRHNLLPIANFGSSVGWIAIMIGLLASSSTIAYIGLFLLSFMLLFQIVTLPVEFNASSRALTILENEGFLDYNETGMAQKMLQAAALTYVAAVASTLLNLLRVFLLISGRNRRD